MINNAFNLLSLWRNLHHPIVRRHPKDRFYRVKDLRCTYWQPCCFSRVSDLLPRSPSNPRIAQQIWLACPYPRSPLWQDSFFVWENKERNKDESMVTIKKLNQLRFAYLSANSTFLLFSNSWSRAELVLLRVTVFTIPLKVWKLFICNNNLQTKIMILNGKLWTNVI